MNTTFYKTSLAAACCLMAGAACALLLPTGTVDLSAGYTDYAHDTLANTLVVTGIVKTTGPGGSNTNITIRLPYFDKKGVLKGQPGLNKDVVNAAILYFEKTWAVLYVNFGDTTVYQSVKCGTGVSVLGEKPTSGLQFAFAGKGGIVMFNESNLTYQLYDKAFLPLGEPRSVLTNPVPINAGTYFYCAHDNQVQIWRVKKGLFNTVSAPGQFFSINEKKKLCCIQSGSTHYLYSYK